jgi:hypothetical protein
VGPTAANPTKSRRRKPETLAFLRRALAGALHEVEIPAQFRDLPRRGYKLFALALQERREWLSWRGHDQRRNDAALLRRVGHEIMGARWVVADVDRERLDRLHAEIARLLERYPPRWDEVAGGYLVSVKLRAMVNRLQKDELTKDLVEAARLRLEDEYSGDPIRYRHAEGLFTWHPGGVSVRAGQLARELGDGRNLPERLRDFVRYHRRTGNLPPRGS